MFNSTTILAIGASAVLLFAIVASVKWYLWKSYCKFWHTRYRETQTQNERLLRAVKDAEDKAKYAESELKHVIDQYKPF